MCKTKPHRPTLEGGRGHALYDVFALAVLSVPQMRKLRALKEELARAKALEAHVEQEKDQKRRDLNAIRNDPAYLELVARDRLDLYREGEKVYRIEQK